VGFFLGTPAQIRGETEDWVDDQGVLSVVLAECKADGIARYQRESGIDHLTMAIDGLGYNWGMEGDFAIRRNRAQITIIVYAEFSDTAKADAYPPVIGARC
jgi:hypothetical protein